MYQHLLHDKWYRVSLADQDADRYAKVESLLTLLLNNGNVQINCNYMSQHVYYYKQKLNFRHYHVKPIMAKISLCICDGVILCNVIQQQQCLPSCHSDLCNLQLSCSDTSYDTPFYKLKQKTQYEVLLNPCQFTLFKENDGGYSQLHI